MPAGESIYTKIALARLQTIQFQLAKRCTHIDKMQSCDTSTSKTNNEQLTTNK